MSQANLFGPTLDLNKIGSIRAKKTIHFDCNDSPEDDIPNEHEVYIKENLLKNDSKNNTEE